MKHEFTTFDTQDAYYEKCPRNNPTHRGRCKMQAGITLKGITKQLAPFIKTFARYMV